MTCPSIQSLLGDYIDKELADDRRKSVDAHLSTCTECRSELESRRSLKELLRRRTGPDPGAEFWQAQASMIRARTVDAVSPAEPIPDQRLTNQRRNFFRSLVSTAASLAILIGALYLGSNRDYHPTAAVIADRPVFLSGSLAGLVDAENQRLIRTEEQRRLARGVLLLGPPGILSRSAGLTDLLIPR